MPQTERAETKPHEVETGGQSSTIHWPVEVKDLDFDSEGRIIIRNSRLAAQIKHDVGTGKNVYITLANSDNYCVVVSKGCP